MALWELNPGDVFDLWGAFDYIGWGLSASYALYMLGKLREYGSHGPRGDT